MIQNDLEYLNKLSVLTLNLDSINDDLRNRLDLFIDTVRKNEWDIICLQELVLPAVKERIKLQLNDLYFVQFSEHSYKKNQYPLISYLMSLLFISLAQIINYQNFINQIFYFLAILFIPQIIVPIVVKLIICLQIKVLKLHTKGDDFYTDLQGLCVLVLRKKFQQPQIIKIKPYNNQGYPFKFSFFYWVQRTFFRPGYMILQLNHKLGIQIILSNSHLVIGDKNQNRILQSKELIKEMNKFNNQKVFQFICGDMNSSFIHNQEKSYPPDLKVITEDNYRDTVEFFIFDQDKIQKNHCITWCGYTNPEVIKESPKDQQRLDYIFARDIYQPDYKLQELHHKLQFDKVSGTPIVSDHYAVETLFEIQKKQQKN